MKRPLALQGNPGYCAQVSIASGKRMTGVEMPIYMYLRLDFASGRNFGPSRTALLEGIDQFGSISAGAREAGLTFRQAWSVVKLMNETFPEPVVEARSRVPASGASLTPLGKKLVSIYRAMEDDAYSALEKHLSALERLLGEDREAIPDVAKWARIRHYGKRKGSRRTTPKAVAANQRG
jgi:molybdate transport system regulatory protein